MIVDSNLIILSSKPEHPEIRDWLAEAGSSISAISRVEVLGYHKMEPAEHRQLLLILAYLKAIPVTDPVLEEAIRLKQLKKMSLGDSIIAGTALLNGGELATRNLKDFQNITGLIASDPTRPAVPVGAL